MFHGEGTPPPHALHSEGHQDNSKGVVELYDWQIGAGPRLNSQSDLWDSIEKDLRKNDVPTASNKLRRGSEEYFRTVCNSLGAKVKFRDNGQYNWEIYFLKL